MNRLHLIILCLGNLLCGTAGALVFAGFPFDALMVFMAFIFGASGMSMALIVKDAVQQNIKAEIHRTAEANRKMNMARAECASLEVQLRKAQRALRHLQHCS
jgi:hypothetical protein